MSAETQDSQRVDVRCPQGPKNLMMKLQRDPESPPPSVTDGLLELSCRDCTRHAKRQMQQAGLSTDFRILHRYLFDGSFVESVREATK